MDGKGGSLEEACIVNWAGSGIVWQASMDTTDAEATVSASGSASSRFGGLL
jgi:hypothetical protein